MFYSMESCKDGTAHGKLDGLLDVLPLIKKYVNFLGSSGRGVGGELKMSMVDFVVWVL